MGSIFKIILFFITAGVIYILINVAMVTSDTTEDAVVVLDDGSVKSSVENNVESVSPFDVFKDTKEQLDSDMHPINKDSLPKCEKDGNVEYGIDGKMCKTSSEQVLTCIDGVAKLNSGLMGKELYLGSFDITLKCKNKEQ